MDDTASTKAAGILTIPGPLRHLPLYEAVAEQLRVMVLEGGLAPGSRISEKYLCEAFEVSRTPLREALKVLNNEGLVELLPNRGAKVTQVDPGEIADLFEVMVELEALSGRLLAIHASDANIEELQALHHRMQAHHQRQELSEYFRLNQQIHHRLAEMSGNDVLLELETTLNLKITRARYATNFQPSRWDESIREHACILEALERRDGEALSRAMRDHMRHTGDAVLHGLPRL